MSVLNAEEAAVLMASMVVKSECVLFVSSVDVIRSMMMNIGEKSELLTRSTLTHVTILSSHSRLF